MSDAQQSGPVKLNSGFTVAMGEKPKLESFVDWDSVFMSKGLAPPAEANEFGTPSEYFGKATGFGRAAPNTPTAPLSPPMAGKMGTASGTPYEAGITGDDPYNGSNAGEAHPHYSGYGGPMDPQTFPTGPAPGSPPPAAQTRQMPFAAQLAPMMAAMGHSAVADTQGGGFIDWGPSESLMVGQMAGGKQEHPVSESQRRWAFAAEKRGELPQGKAREWSRRVKGKDLPESSAEKSLDALTDLTKSLLAMTEIGLPRAPQHTPQQQPRRVPAPRPRMEKSMHDEQTFDMAGRPLAKGLYAFRNTQREATLPDEYLYDYLCSFVEEAYEHESKEDAHANLSAKDQLMAMSRAIMNELVQSMPSNPNLMRAAKKFTVTKDSVAMLLVQKGIYKPKSDSQWVDDMDSWRALTGESMMLSMDHAALPFDIRAQPGIAVHRPPAADGSHLLAKSDPVDPVADLAARRAAQTAHIYGGLGVPSGAAVPTLSASCPVHNGRDITKAQNLYNAQQPCTCHSRANAYG